MFKRSKHTLLVLIQTLILLTIAPIAQAEYEPSASVEKTMVSIGSDTLLNLMKGWKDAFKTHHPNSDIKITAEGSSTAPPALTEGTSHLAPMSRKMKSGEKKAFELKYGYKPTPVRVALDALGVRRKRAINMR